MQFIPGTWAAYGADGNGDGVKDPHNVYDAARAAGEYLCADGADLRKPQGLVQAVLRYNHSMDYVSTVLRWMQSYSKSTVTVPDRDGVVPTPIGDDGNVQKDDDPTRVPTDDDRRPAQVTPTAGPTHRPTSVPTPTPTATLTPTTPTVRPSTPRTTTPRTLPPLTTTPSLPPKTPTTKTPATPSTPPTTTPPTTTPPTTPPTNCPTPTPTPTVTPAPTVTPTPTPTPDPCGTPAPDSGTDQPSAAPSTPLG
jgi:hypothetical protein